MLGFLFVLLVPLISLFFSLHTISDYGTNWDEPYHFRRGQAFLHFFLTGKLTYDGIPKYPPLLGDPESSSFRNSEEIFRAVQKNPNLSDPNYKRSYYQDDAWNGEYFINEETEFGHPPLNGISAALFNRIFYQKLGIVGDLESYHLFEISCVSLLIFFVTIFMYKNFGLIASLTSSLILTTYPLLVGEQHFNIKDPIETTFFTITILSFFNAFTKKSLNWLLISILSFTFAFSIKLNIIFASIPIGIWLIFYLRKTKKIPKKFIVPLILSPIFVITFFIFINPAIWKNISQGILKTLEFYVGTGYGAYSQPISYYILGLINKYPLEWIFYTTPLPSLALTLFSIFFIKRYKEKSYFPLLIFIWLGVTILRISLFGALSYGGVRLIMEFIPAMAILGGLSAKWVFLWLKERKIIFNESIKIIFILIICLSFIPTIKKLISIHPNENVYFNELIGGLSGAKEKNINSWGNSNGNAYYKAIIWLNENAEKNSKLTIPIGSIGNIPRFKLRKDISLSPNYWSGPNHEGEYVLELTYDYPQMKWFSLNYLNTTIKPVYEVTVDGIPIVKLWKNSPEYVLPQYKKYKEVEGKIATNNNNGILLIELANVEKIMKITLKQTTTGCTQLETGYVDTSIDGKNWVREIEDIARDQLKHAKIKNIEKEFTFFFVAQNAKYIRFHTENKTSCIFKTYQSTISVLDNN